MVQARSAVAPETPPNPTAFAVFLSSLLADEKLIGGKAGTGKTITVAYGGGSRPGESRQLTVISCSNAEMRVREVGSTLSKQYKLEKVLWAENSSGQKVISEKNIQTFQSTCPKNPPLPIFDTLEQYSDYLCPDLEQAGWHIHQTATLFGVGAYFKNGKPKKSPSVVVTYQDRSTEIVWDMERNDFITIPREPLPHDRPWRVDSWRMKEGKTFGLLNRAMELFMAEVRTSDPQQATSAHTVAPAP